MRRNHRRSRYSSGLSFYEDRNTGTGRTLFEAFLWIVYSVIAVFFAVVCFRNFGFRVSAIGSSMEPGIHAGQNVLVNRLAYRMSTPSAGDVIAFYPGGDENMHPSIKRVVAVPGDSVQVLDGVLLVNGVPCTLEDSYSSVSDAGIAENLVLLEDNEYFVMGDNPSESEDSRSAGIGAVRESDMIGRVWLRLPMMHSTQQDGT